MAIYHLTVKNISRAKGQSACATLSYILSDKIIDERLGKTYYGFGGADRIMQANTILPDNIDPQMKTASAIFNSLELYDKSSNARIAKHIEAALPREISLENSICIVEEYINNHFSKHGYPAVYSIHSDKDNNNPHVHILVANRSIDPTTHTWAKTKTKKEYALDAQGNRIPLLDPVTGLQKIDSRNRKQWKRISVEENLMDKKEFLQELRDDWAIECNKHLPREKHIDASSFATRGIDAIPTIHEGYVAREIHQAFVRGERHDDSTLVQQNKRIKTHNQILKQLKTELGQIVRTLSDLLKGDHVHDRLRKVLQRARGYTIDGSVGRENENDRPTEGDSAYKGREAREAIKQRLGTVNSIGSVGEFRDEIEREQSVHLRCREKATRSQGIKR